MNERRRSFIEWINSWGNEWMHYKLRMLIKISVLQPPLSSVSSVCGLHGASVYLKLSGKHEGGGSGHFWQRSRQFPSLVEAQRAQWHDPNAGHNSPKEERVRVSSFPGDSLREEGNKEYCHWLVSWMLASCSPNFSILLITRPRQSSPASLLNPITSPWWLSFLNIYSSDSSE